MSEMDLFKKALAERRIRQEQTATKKGMGSAVLEELCQIEKCEKVKILHCVELGSRSLGVASPCSDYNVRFIYLRPKEFYLRLDQTRDVIRWQRDDTLDIRGWDLKKALTLLHRSDPVIFEWNSSPVVYKTTEEWQRISSAFGRYFSARSALDHYLNGAKENYGEYLKGDVVRLKEYFYVLRPLLACKWILEEGTPPPMDFRVLMEKCLERELVPDIEKLLDLKMNTPGIAEGERPKRVNEYIDKTIAEIENTVEVLPCLPVPGWNELNELFWQIVEA